MFSHLQGRVFIADFILVTAKGSLQVTVDQTGNVIAFAGNTMVFESVKRFALRGLNDLMRVLMENVDDALFDLSEKVENDSDRSMYFDAMREIRLKRKILLERFDAELQQNFDRLILDKPSIKASQQTDELSLVDHSELEDSLAIDNMISKARPHFEDDLFAVAERLKVILHRKQIKDDQNPLDPKGICDGFHHASAALETDIKVKLIFYKLFDKYVISNLGHFYRELNDYFIQKGVLPEFKASQERMKHTTRFMANRISRSYREDRDSNQDKDLSMESFEGGASKGGSNTGQPQFEGNLLSMLQQMLSPGLGSDLPPMVQGSDAGSGPSFVPAPGAEASAVSAGSGALPYMTALTNLQSSSMHAQPLASIDPQQLKTHLHQQLVTFKQQNSQQDNAADNQIIDIVSMLFDFFFDDEALPDPIKVLIGRLQIPILKVAILDKNFFNHKKHPARKLLDSISKASLGWSDDLARDKALVSKIEQIVNFLLQEFEQDIAVFEQALEQFQQFVKDEGSRAELKLEQVKEGELQRDQQIQQAQEIASRFIKHLIDKHELSFDVIDFLDGVWKSVLFNTLLTQGESSPHWKNLRSISSTLVWTLIPKHNEQDKNKLLKTLPSLLRAMSKGMELVHADTQSQNKVFQMLVLEHAKTVRQTSKNLVTRIDDNTVWPERSMEDAFAAFNAGRQPTDDSIDRLLSDDGVDEAETADDAVSEIVGFTTEQVIQDLDEFTACVNKGDITVDEEIILDSAPQTSFLVEANADEDDFLEQVQALQLGAWVEFLGVDAKSIHAKLSWRSNVTGKYVFVDRHGDKVKNMTRYGLAAELRAGSAKLIESVSVFDRAINSFMSTLRH